MNNSKISRELMFPCLKFYHVWNEKIITYNNKPGYFLLFPGFGTEGGAAVGLLGGGGGSPVGLLGGKGGEVDTGLVEPIYLTCAGAGVGACLFFTGADVPDDEPWWTDVAFTGAGGFAWVTIGSWAARSLWKTHR